MTVKHLIGFLQTQDPELPIVYRCCSEYAILGAEDIHTGMLQPARGDGWVHDSWGTKHFCTEKYLIFPGN